MNDLQLAIIGGGNMGRALIGGLLKRGMPATRISVAEIAEAGRAALARDFGVRVFAGNAEAIAGAQLIVVAVKPQDVRAALGPLRDQLRKSQPLVVSVAAGIRIQSLATWCGEGVPLVRAMPNRPALIGAGATGLYAPPQISAAHRTRAEELMQALGSVVWVPEEDALDTVTALSGSGPAYFFLLAEQMMQAAVAQGLDPATARTLAVQTLYGAGLLAHTSDGDLARLRAEVTSKGGTTAAALEVLGDAGLHEIIARALEAATQRSRELAAQFGGSS